MMVSLLKFVARPNALREKCPRANCKNSGVEEGTKKRGFYPLSKREAELGCASPRLSDTARDAPRLRPSAHHPLDKLEPRATARHHNSPNVPMQRCRWASPRTLRAHHVNISPYPAPCVDDRCFARLLCRRLDWPIVHRYVRNASIDLPSDLVVWLPRGDLLPPSRTDLFLPLRPPSNPPAAGAAHHHGNHGRMPFMPDAAMLRWAAPLFRLAYVQKSKTRHAIGHDVPASFCLAVSPRHALGLSAP